LCVCGDESRIIVNGTFQGAVRDIPLAEMEFVSSMTTIMRIAEGKVVEEWQEDDQLGLVRQLGMELRPKEAEKSVGMGDPMMHHESGKTAGLLGGRKNP
jgi:hypothetical protein